MAKRKAISSRARFEVFKRDGFKCQYCGRSAPEIVLRVDHIDPVSNGGENDLLNLVTACFDCNAGKSDKLLSDNSAVELQVEQLQVLNERRVQLEMLLEWKKSLKSLAEVELQHALDIWRNESGRDLTEPGLAEFRKLIKSFGVDRVVSSIEIACEKYTDRQQAFNKIGGICYVSKKSESDPTYQTTALVRGILTKRGLYVNYALADYIRDAYDVGFNHEDIVELAKSSRSWTAFREALQ